MRRDGAQSVTAITLGAQGEQLEGITNPPIDDLLEKVSSKYALVIYAAKRARQINDYYAQLGEGLLEYVGPLVEPGPREKPLSIALREIHAGLLEHTEGE
ncbi:DNA-directed RNA polymerase subunit omega [Saccharomonospora sp. NB11]|uniref:DNA-directed RNA polymerase subunit omega n=1 Tax=Saccharomonospora sp. NB11 TaxID=1642298 RepID=UPI001E39495D